MIFDRRRVILVISGVLITATFGMFAMRMLLIVSHLPQVMSSLSVARNSCSAQHVSSVFGLPTPELVNLFLHRAQVIPDYVGVEFSDTFGTAAVLLSWLTNVLGTFLAAYKTWYVSFRVASGWRIVLMLHAIRRHRQTIKADLEDGDVRKRTRKVMLLFVESGIMYSVLWVRPQPEECSLSRANQRDCRRCLSHM